MGNVNIMKYVPSYNVLGQVVGTAAVKTAANSVISTCRECYDYKYGYVRQMQTIINCADNHIISGMADTTFKNIAELAKLDVTQFFESIKILEEGLEDVKKQL